MPTLQVIHASRKAFYVMHARWIGGSHGARGYIKAQKDFHCLYSHKLLSVYRPRVVCSMSAGSERGSPSKGISLRKNTRIFWSYARDVILPCTAFCFFFVVFFSFLSLNAFIYGRLYVRGLYLLVCVHVYNLLRAVFYYYILYNEGRCRRI